jgi:NIMA (never in mitosis gene a)-related kinase
MEYANKGDLYEEVAKNLKSSSLLGEEYIWKLFICMVKGLKVLH